jgi:glutamine cyclotransferase
VVFASFEAARLSLLVAAAGSLAVVLLLTALSKARPESTVTALAGLGACWVASAWTQGAQAPGGTIFVAAGLLVTAELAFASLEQASVADEPELLSRRLAGIAGRGLGALVLAAILLAALGLNAGGGLALEAVGVAAAVGLLLLVFSLARPGAQTTER